MGKVVLFDLDGTLIDSALVIVEIINTIRLQRHCAPLTAGSIRPHLSKGGKALVAASLAEAARQGDGDLTLFRALYAEAAQDSSMLYANVKATLAALGDAGFTLAVCTNKPAQLAERALAAAGIAHHFDLVASAGDGVPSKPDPAVLLEACRRLAVAPGDTMLIGDSEADAEAARRVGMPFVFASYGYPVGDPAEIQCDYAINCMSELPVVVATALTATASGEVT